MSSSANISCLPNKSVLVRDYFDPIIKPMGLNYALHIRLFNNGQAYLLGNNPNYVEHFIKAKYFLPEPGTFTKYEMHLWSGVTSLQTYDSQVANMRNLFNIDHQISFFEPHKDYIDIYDLGTTSQRPEIINFYINNRNFLENIFHEYKKLFASDLKVLDANPFEFKLRPKNFEKHTDSNIIPPSITKRELDCLFLLAQGLTSKKIALKLEISARTAEKHLENIKIKFNANNRIELLNKYNECLEQKTG